MWQAALAASVQFGGDGPTLVIPWDRLPPQKFVARSATVSTTPAKQRLPSGQHYAAVADRARVARGFRPAARSWTCGSRCSPISLYDSLRVLGRRIWADVILNIQSRHKKPTIPVSRCIAK
jgi:hypothetical protein